MSDGMKNLMVTRGEKSVWDKPGFAATLSTYDQERWMTAAWASVLAMLGARRGGFFGGLLAMTGSVLTVRAAMGRRDFSTARDWVDRSLRERGWRDKDVVVGHLGRVVPGQRLAVVDADRRRTRRPSRRRHGAVDGIWSWSFPVTRARRSAQRAQHQRSRALGLDGGRRRARRCMALSRRRAAGWAWPRSAACWCGAAPPGTATSTRRSASTPPAPARTRAGRSAARAAPTSTRASRSTVRSRSSTASGATSRTCRSSCSHLESVERMTDTLSHWRARGPGGKMVEWDAEIINEVPEPGDRLALDRRLRRRQRRLGELRGCRPGPRHARARAPAVQPAGRQGRRRRRAGCSAAMRRREIREDLRRFKQLVEAGEVPTHRRPAARMKALCWYGTNDVRVEQVPDPKILNPRDAIVKVTLTAICGSDLHSRRLHPDDEARRHPRPRVHGRGRRGRIATTRSSRSATASSCRSRSRAAVASSASGSCGRPATTRTRTPGWPRSSTASRGSGLFGYSHMIGGYAGGQAEYVRVPFADVGPIKVPRAADRRAGAVPVRHLPDRLHGGGELQHPAGRHRRGLGLRPGRPVRDPERLAARRRPGDRDRPRARAAAHGGRARARPRPSNYEQKDVFETLKEMTGGRGPDACIDAVGLEAHGTDARRLLRQGQDRDVPGDRSHLGAAPGDPLPAARAARSRSPASTAASSTRCRSARRSQGPDAEDGPDPRAALPADRCWTASRRGEIDPSFVITHRVRLDDAPDAYKTFRDKEDGCIKVVMKP